MMLQEDDVDNIVKQVEADITSGLNRFTTTRVLTKRQGKASNQWLSTEALSTRKETRRLERTYSKYKNRPTDRHITRLAISK